MRYLIFIYFILFSFRGVAQTEIQGTSRQSQRAATQDREKAPISDYQIITAWNDTTMVDTSLTIEDDYRFNYLRKDNFGLLSFSNVGQTYNNLTYDFEEDASLLPLFGARARHYNFMEADDINYYRVPTPFTELYFKTVFEQGQTLDSFFTINTSPNFNASIAYKGLRSLGKYQHILTSTGNFRATISYNTKDRRYFLKTHFVSQDLMNQENGGLTELSLSQYLSGDEEYEDRSRLDVLMEDAESILLGKRFYLNHFYQVVQANDSLASNALNVGHVFDFSDKKYRYEQASAHDFFGPSYESINLRDEVELERMYNEIFVDFNNRILGGLRVKASHTNYNYGYNTVLDLQSGFIEDRIKGDQLAIGGSYTKAIGDFQVTGDAMLGLGGSLTGYSYKGEAGYQISDELRARFGIKGNDRAPNFNFLLYQSDYVNYNWQNEFGNVVRHTAYFNVDSDRYLNLTASYTTIDNHTFFGKNVEGFVKPFQYDGTVNYLSVQGQREFRLGKFALDNRILYQQVLDGADVMKLPDLVTRNTLYYHDHWFDRALYLQTGFTLNYFTSYHMNGYDPVLAEFFVQNDMEIEGFPRLDFFFNGRIQQARIFFKLEHINALLMGNEGFSAPYHPYRDFGVRFGLVWNFFL